MNAELINSFYAINKATGQPISADARGFISPAANTEIVFANPHPDSGHQYVEVTDLAIETGENAVKLQINDNERYPFYVDANSAKGLSAVYVYKIKVLSGGPFAYEALTTRA